MTTQQIATQPDAAALLENVMVKGDLSKLNEAQRLDFYGKVCESLGLNPLTQPFEYIVLNGKLRLYAKKDCTDQLRSLRKVSITKLERDSADGVYSVTAYASTPDGRTDSSLGAVPIEGLKGEARANAMMKSETKAKRRVTLSICGLGILDESEVESIAPSAAPTVVTQNRHPEPAPVPRQPAARALPTGAEFEQRIHEKDAVLAAEGLCNPGELFSRITDVGVKAGHGADLTQWNETGVRMAVDLVKRFEADRREAAEALNTPAMRPDATDDERDALIRAIDAKRDVSWAALLTIANVPGLEGFAEPANVGAALHPGGAVKLLTRLDQLQSILAALEKPALATKKPGKRAG